MATIVVVDLAHVTVDGVQAGSVTDVLMNYASVDGIRGSLFAALQAWSDSVQASHAAERQALNDAGAKALADLAARHASELSARDAQFAASLADRDAKFAAEVASRNLKEDQLNKAIADLKGQAAPEATTNV